MDIYEKYGLTRIINAAGKETVLTASAVLPDVIETVSEGVKTFYDLDDLNEAAGRVISDVFGAPWGCVTACAAAGITLSVAAAMTEDDPARIAGLPDTAGMRNEVILQKGHAVSFGAPITQMIRISGARVREIGNVHGVKEWHLEDAIGKDTAAAVFVVSHLTTRRGSLPLKTFVAICHERGVPVIVDGAAQSFIVSKILSSGADLVICSAHKYLSGFTAGIVCGREDLVRTVTRQNTGIGRAMKVGKEGIIGTMAALGYRKRMDVPAWQAEQERKAGVVIRRLEGIPGVEAVLDPDPTGNPYCRARLRIDERKAGISPVTLLRTLAAGIPSIRIRDYNLDEGFLHVDVIDVTEDELAVVCGRLEEILTASAGEKKTLTEKHGSGKSDPLRDWLGG